MLAECLDAWLWFLNCALEGFPGASDYEGSQYRVAFTMKIKVFLLLSSDPFFSSSDRIFRVLGPLCRVR